MKNENTIYNYREIYDKVWKENLETCKKDFGDLELSLLFLQQSNVLDYNFRILEIGCGVGKLCNALVKLGYKNVIGGDISSIAIKYGKKLFPHIDINVIDGECLNLTKEYFDICISFDLIEHLQNIDKHFSEVINILKPNGLYLFQTPNIFTNAIHSTLKYKSFEWKIYHPSLQNYWSLKKQLKYAGFKEMKFIKMPYISEFKKKQLPSLMKVIYKMIPWKILPMCLQTNFYVIASKL